MGIDVGFPFARLEGAAIGTGGELSGELTDSVVAIFVFAQFFGEFVGILDDMVGRFEGHRRDGVEPDAGNGRAALVAVAPVIGRESDFADKGLGTPMMRKDAVGNDFVGTVWRLPTKLDHGELFFVFEHLETDRIATAAVEENLSFDLTDFIVGSDPAIDRRNVVVIVFVDEKAHPVASPNRELVDAGVPRIQRTPPVHAELLHVRGHAFRQTGKTFAVVEGDLRVDALEFLTLEVVVPGSFAVVEGIVALDPRLVIFRGKAGVPKSGNEIAH